MIDYLRGPGYRAWFFGPAGLPPVERFRPETHQPARPGPYWEVKDYHNNIAFLPEAPTA